jgi:hypothetical protein
LRLLFNISLTVRLPVGSAFFGSALQLGFALRQARRGLPALLVLSIASEPSEFLTSHAQPEPNVPTAVAVNFSLNAAAFVFHACSYAFRNSSLGMCACVSIVRNVEPFILRWFGIVKGVRVPSGFSRSIAMCSRIRT